RTPDGKVRAALAARDDATPSLALYDGDGTARAGLELGADGQANLWFAGKDGQVTVSLNPRNLRMTDAEGAVFVTRTALVLADRKQRNRVTLGVKPDGSPSLTLADKEGRTGALVDVVDDGSRLGLFYDGLVRAGIGFGPGGSQLNLYGEDGKDHATLSLAPDGATGLIFHGQDGKQRAALGVAPNNASGLSLFDKGGSQRAAMSVVPEGSPRLELFDAGGGRRANLALSAAGLPLPARAGRSRAGRPIRRGHLVPRTQQAEHAAQSQARRRARRLPPPGGRGGRGAGGLPARRRRAPRHRLRDARGREPAPRLLRHHGLRAGRPVPRPRRPRRELPRLRGRAELHGRAE